MSLPSLRLNAPGSVGFWTHIPFEQKANIDWKEKTERFLVNCFNFGGRTLRHIPMDKREGPYAQMMVEVNENKLSSLGLVKIVVKVVACLLFGVAILPIKYILRKKYKFVVFDSSNLNKIPLNSWIRLSKSEMDKLPFHTYFDDDIGAMINLAQIDLPEYKNLFFIYRILHDGDDREIRKLKVDFDAKIQKENVEYELTLEEFNCLAIIESQSRLPRFKDCLFLHNPSYLSSGVKSIIRINLPLDKPTCISAKILSELGNNRYTSEFHYKAEPIHGDSENMMVTRTIQNNF